MVALHILQAAIASMRRPRGCPGPSLLVGGASFLDGEPPSVRAVSGRPRIVIVHADRPLGAVTAATVDALRDRGADVDVWSLVGAIDVAGLPPQHDLFVLKHSYGAGGFAPAFAVAFALSALPLIIVVTKVREPAEEPSVDVVPAVDLTPTPAESTAALPTAALPTAALPTTALPTTALTGEAQEQPEPAPPAGGGRIPIAPFATVGFLITGSAYLFTALFPVFATEYAGLSPAAVGAIYVVGSLLALTGPVWGWLADRVSFGMVLSLRSIANVASSVVYLVSPTLAGVAVGKALDDTGKAAFRPAWGAMMAHVASHDRRHRARIMAWLGVGEGAGEVAGPIVAGLVWTVWGVPAVLGIRIGTAVAAEAAPAFVTHRYGSPTADRSVPVGRRDARQAAPRSGGSRERRPTRSRSTSAQCSSRRWPPPPPRPAPRPTRTDPPAPAGRRSRTPPSSSPCSSTWRSRPPRPRAHGAFAHRSRPSTTCGGRSCRLHSRSGALQEVSALHRKYLSIFSPPGSTVSISTK